MFQTLFQSSRLRILRRACSAIHRDSPIVRSGAIVLRHCCGSRPIRGPNICVPSQQVDEGQQNGNSGVQNIELLFSNDAISRAWRISSTCGDYAKPSGFAISQRGTGADAEKWCAAGGHFLRRIPIPMWIRHRESQISRIHPASRTPPGPNNAIRLQSLAINGLTDSAAS